MDRRLEDSMLMIINGENEKGDIPGHVDFVGKIYYDKDIQNFKDTDEADKYKPHVNYLLEYGREKYPDVQVFNILSDNHLYRTVVYFLSIFNNIVYLNISSNRHQQRGLLFMPEEICEAQKQALYEVARKCLNVNVQLVYDLNFNDGDVDLKEFDSKRGSSFEDVLDDYFLLLDRKKEAEKKHKN